MDSRTRSLTGEEIISDRAKGIVTSSLVSPLIGKTVGIGYINTPEKKSEDIELWSKGKKFTGRTVPCSQLLKEVLRESTP